MTSFFEDHLSLDAVVAFADGEMGLVAFQRAAAHLSRCPACSGEVAEQSSARQLLRRASAPQIPVGLLDTLRLIPVALPAPAPVAGIAHDPRTGRATRTLDRPGTSRGRGFRLGAGALVAGLAVGALAVAAVGERPPAGDSPSAPDAGQISLVGGVPGELVPSVVSVALFGQR